MSDCYVVQVYELSSMTPAGRESLRKQVFSGIFAQEAGDLLAADIRIPALPMGELVPVEMDTFVSRSWQKAHELMMDCGLQPIDWVCCQEESDSDGKIRAIFLSTDGGYLCRILRVPLL